ncbi:hypothetical protein BS17DRAFT_776475 [Gyrodon lividus]|nr:hypothetical protein BS17DRAFT_776475 [Gyrodon lividus]
MGDSDLEYALKQVEDLQKKGLSPEVKIKVDTAMAERATSSKDDIIAEIKELVQRAINTDKTFENIRVQLGVVDQNDYKDKYGAAIPKLQPTWVKYQKRWTALLWRSRNAATRAEAYLRDFVDVVLDTILEEDSTYEDNLKDLNAFIKRPNPDNPLLQSDDFAKLQADVEAFTATFATYADDLGAQISTKITTLQTDIATLKKELVECNKLVVQMGIALGVTVGAVAIGIGIVALFALGPAAPAAIVSILVAGIGAAITELSQLIAALTRKNIGSTRESQIAAATLRRRSQ